MFMRCLIVLENLKETQPSIDEDLLHAPITGTTLFGGELAKLQEANTKRANAVSVFRQQRPLSPIPLGHMSVEEEVITIQVREGLF